MCQDGVGKSTWSMLITMAEDGWLRGCWWNVGEASAWAAVH